MAALKPFTKYVCPVGGYALGHSSIWTGAYELPGANDGVCICGETLIEETSDGFRYRLEFETIDPHDAAAAYEALRGRSVWAALSDAEWDQLSWHPMCRESESRGSIADQYETLVRWAESREQPIRSVRMLQSAQTAWEPIDA